MAEEFVEYGLPQDWQQLSHDDFKKLRFESTSTGHSAEEFEQAMDIMADPTEIGTTGPSPAKAAEQEKAAPTEALTLTT